MLAISLRSNQSWCDVRNLRFRKTQTSWQDLRVNVSYKECSFDISVKLPAGISMLTVAFVAATKQDTLLVGRRVLKVRDHGESVIKQHAQRTDHDIHPREAMILE